MKQYTLLVRTKHFQHRIQFDRKDKAEKMMNWPVWEYARLINNRTLRTEAVKEEP